MTSLTMTSSKADVPPAAPLPAAPAPVRSCARPGSVAVVHDDDHGHGLLRRDQIVENEIRAALKGPARFVFPAAVLQIQNRIARLRVGIVVRRSVDEGAAPLAGDLGQVRPDAHLSVRHILVGIVVDALLRHFDSACILAGAVEGVTGRVVHRHAVDDQLIVVEARNQRRSGDAPHSVRPFRHVMTAGQRNLDLLRIGGFELEGHAVIAVDSGILGAQDVGGRGLRSAGGCPKPRPPPGG